MSIFPYSAFKIEFHPVFREKVCCRRGAEAIKTGNWETMTEVEIKQNKSKTIMLCGPEVRERMNAQVVKVSVTVNDNSHFQ